MDLRINPKSILYLHYGGGVVGDFYPTAQMMDFGEDAIDPFHESLHFGRWRDRNF